MAFDRVYLKTLLAQAHGVSPAEPDMAALLAELAALEPRLARWRLLELRDVEPAFLVRDPVPRKGKVL